MSDISCHVLHDLWPSKGVIFAKFISENISKISKFYASASMHHRKMYGSLWGPPGHGSIDILDLDTLSEGILWQILSELTSILAILS